MKLIMKSAKRTFPYNGYFKCGPEVSSLMNVTSKYVLQDLSTFTFVGQFYRSYNFGFDEDRSAFRRHYQFNSKNWK